MNSTDDNNFSDFLHNQYQEVKEAVNKNLDVNQEKYGARTLIGEGTQKRIYQVYDNSCSREVAIAILKNATAQEEAQFLREARITALLEHPNIMPVYENGIDAEGQYYFTMKLIHGETLQSILDKIYNNDEEYVNKYPLTSRIDIFQKVCEAIAYAHSKGIIHRDLKPENIQVGEFGEVLLSDWGLASVQFDKCDEQILNDKVLNEIDLKVSLKGLIKGTPGYIAPEILNSKNAYSIQSDIFALGAILHSILTSKIPVDSETIQICINKTKEGEIKPFEHSSFPLPESLKAICKKALSVNKKDRYQSVNEISIETRKYQQGFATNAEEAGFLTQLNLFYKRNKKACNISLAFIIIIVAGSISAINSIRAKEKESTEILQELVKTYKEKEALEQELIPTYQQKAYDLFVHVQLDSALALIEVAYNIDPDNPKSKALFGKMLIAKQQFYEAEILLKDVDNKLSQVCKKYSALQIEGRLSHKELINFLKEVGTKQANDISWIYKNILTEEFLHVRDIDKKTELIKAELRFRNKGLQEINIDLKIIDDDYYIDISNNPKLHTALILGKLGPINVKRLNISDTSILRLDALTYMKIEEFHARNTGVLSMHGFSNHYAYLDAEGSKTDFSKYLNNKPVKFLNIHNTPFSNYHVLPTLKQLRTLVVTKGKLPNKVKMKLHKDCTIIER